MLFYDKKNGSMLSCMINDSVRILFENDFNCSSSCVKKTMFPIIWKNDKIIFKDPFEKIRNFVDAGLILTTIISVGPAIGARNCFLVLTLSK